LQLIVNVPYLNAEFDTLSFYTCRWEMVTKINVGCPDCVCMVVGFTTTTAISAYLHSWPGVLDTTFM